LCGSNST
jgi:large subunit ribosomal protein L13e